MKRQIASILLLLFMWSITPVDLWHDCHDHVEHASDLAIDAEHETCAICVYDFSPFEGEQSVNFESVLVSFAVEHSEIEAQFEQSSPLNLDSRGPPAA